MLTLIPELDTLGIDPYNSDPVRFTVLAQALLDAPYRAVGPKELDRVLNEIVLDSLAPVALGILSTKSQSSKRGGSPIIIDIGTGSGIPALPLGLVLPHATITGIDSSTKRVHYAARTADQIGLTNVKFMSGRLFEYGSRKLGQKRKSSPDPALAPYLGSADFVLARGLAQLHETISLAVAYIATHGRILVYSTAEAVERGMESVSESIQAKWNFIRHDYGRQQSERAYTILEIFKQ